MNKNPLTLVSVGTSQTPEGSIKMILFTSGGVIEITDPELVNLIKSHANLFLKCQS